MLTNQASPFYIHSKPLTNVSITFLRHSLLIPSFSKSTPVLPPFARLMLLITSPLLSIVTWHPDSLPTLPQS
jgi:hypothetical protein